jgi:methyltransferase (TIGR00027 family)
MAQKASNTAIGPIFTVAVEQHFPEEQRILEDKLAYPILPFSLRAFVCLMQLDFIRDWMVRSTEKSLPGIWGGFMCRKRYINEQLADSANRIEQVVNLGAGFDTRVYELESLKSKQIWEVDFPKIIKYKKKRLQKLFEEVPTPVTLVPIDFNSEDLQSVLESHEYSSNKPAFFIWEAVTQYLSEAGIKTTFDFLSRSYPGSRLVFTYIRKDFIKGKTMYGQEKLYEKYVEKDKTWTYGMDPEKMEDFLNSCGWRLIEDIGYEELAEQFVPKSRKLITTPIERIVYTESAG